MKPQTHDPNHFQTGPLSNDIAYYFYIEWAKSVIEVRADTNARPGDLMALEEEILVALFFTGIRHQPDADSMLSTIWSINRLESVDPNPVSPHELLDQISSALALCDAEFTSSGGLREVRKAIAILNPLIATLYDMVCKHEAEERPLPQELIRPPPSSVSDLTNLPTTLQLPTWTPQSFPSAELRRFGAQRAARFNKRILPAIKELNQNLNALRPHVLRGIWDAMMTIDDAGLLLSQRSDSRWWDRMWSNVQSSASFNAGLLSLRTNHLPNRSGIIDDVIELTRDPSTLMYALDSIDLKHILDKKFLDFSLAPLLAVAHWDLDGGLDSRGLEKKLSDLARNLADWKK